MAKFFEEMSDQSQVKATIVAKYFWAWAKAIIPTVKMRGKKIAYIDLFAGPGRYRDGSSSTPMLILEKAIGDVDLRQMLATIFNDVNKDHSFTLENEIKQLAGIETLKHQPKIKNFEVGTELVKQFEAMNFVPTLFFIDPWGYKGLSLRLINAVLKDWGCECIFFFNYNRINMGLGNESVESHLNALFEEERGDKLRQKLEGLPPDDRETEIVESLAEALKDYGGKYVLPFRFVSAGGERTSHYLIFVSKHPLGYKIMKNVMANESSDHEQGVPTFEYIPSYRKQGLLFELSRPLDELGEMLLTEFAGKSLTREDIFEKHNYGRRFIEKNYLAILKQLETQGKIKCDPPAAARPTRNGERTFATHVKVTFPKKE